MKMVALRDMTRDELEQKRREMLEELFNLNMRKTMKELDNPLKLRTLRRDIARIETLLSEDKLNIRKIVEAPVSILDQAKAKSSSGPAEKSE
ncbi:50S ribosomal protein L29 [Candidatus Zixiibacteriota bacterium]|nr:50S ribosomal protein L29 [candidate division Zixibacteria bacterium]